MSCPLLTYAMTPWRQAQVCLRPLPSYGEDRASRPPPLQHRVPILAASALDLSNVSAQRRPYPDCSGAFSVTGQATFGIRRKRRVLLEWSCFSLAASRTYVWASLRYSVADVARQRVFGMFATPESSRPTQSPLGAFHLPQALTSVAPPPSQGGLSLAWVRWSFPRLSSIPAASRSSLRNPKLWYEPRCIASIG